MNSIGLLTIVSFVLAEAGEKVPSGAPVLATHLVNVVIYSLVGVVILGGCFLLMKRMMPFSVTKEIEQDQNVALAIVMGSVIIGMSIIIAAAIL